MNGVHQSIQICLGCVHSVLNLTEEDEKSGRISESGVVLPSVGNSTKLHACACAFAEQDLRVIG
jgi:hypothetical protein